MKNVVVLGAGISGLALAWELRKRHCRVTILEKSNRAGGWIHTIEKDDFLFEQGPRSCRPKGAGIATLKLIEELGLQDQVIPGKTIDRYLFIDGKLQTLPSGTFSFLFSPLTRGLMPAIMKDLWTPANRTTDESIYDFFTRRFSSSMAERLIDPMTLGIYAGDIKKLSLKSCFPKIYEWEQQHGSVIRGAFFAKKKKQELSPFVKEMQKYSLFSFKGGMETLTKELSKRLEIELSTTATSLTFHSDHVEVGLSTGQKLETDHVYSTLPAKDLAAIWSNPDLAKISSNSLAVINLGYRKKVLKKEGFGYLIPSKEQEPILGVVFDSCIFPEQNRSPDETRLTVMMRPNGTEEKMKHIALASLSKHLGIDAIPDSISIKCVNQAIPQYEVGHSALIASLQSPSQHFTFLGSSFYGVAVNDCIHNIIGLNLN